MQIERASKNMLIHVKKNKFLKMPLTSFFHWTAVQLEKLIAIGKLKQHRMKMLLDDIKSNRFRVHSIFTRIVHGQGKDDMLSILKQLAAEELLSPEQFEKLSELEDLDLPIIALIIKDSKVGQ